MARHISVAGNRYEVFNLELLMIYIIAVIGLNLLVQVGMLSVGHTAPFAVVIVELEEQAGLRMVSNVVDVPPEDVRIGMPVEVTFRSVAEDVWLPLFKKR